MQRDLVSNLLLALCIAPVDVTADVDGVGVDVRNYESSILFASGGAIVAAGLVTPKAYESDDSTNGTDGTWTAVAAADLQGAFVALTAGSVQKVGYVGRKRWVRVSADYTSGTSIVFFSGVIAGRPHSAPVA